MVTHYTCDPVMTLFTCTRPENNACMWFSEVFSRSCHASGENFTEPLSLYLTRKVSYPDLSLGILVKGIIPGVQRRGEAGPAAKAAGTATAAYAAGRVTVLTVF